MASNDFGYTMTSKINEWKMSNSESQAFRIDCECTSNDHAIDAWIDIEFDDDDTGHVAVHFYQTLKTKWWKKPTEYDWINSIINRITGIWELAFKGYIEYHSDFVVSKNNVDGLIAVLEEAQSEFKRIENGRGSSKDSKK